MPHVIDFANDGRDIALELSIDGHGFVHLRRRINAERVTQPIGRLTATEARLLATSLTELAEYSEEH